MPVIDGQKFACDSCIRGHRVSNCRHDDRPLKLIPPKGRPVKQCEHCRTARKSKSHHGKCDCGSKKEKKDKDKDLERTDANDSDSGCCCHKGDSCVCGSRSDALEMRMERSLKRVTQPVKCKPVLSTSNSESKLTVFMNGHHKPCHRNNNLAHTSGLPYTIPKPPKPSRPHTLHGASSFAQTTEARDFLDSLPRAAADDMWLDQTSIKLFSPPSVARSSSGDSLDFSSGPETADPFSFDFDKHFATRSVSTEAKPLENLAPLSEENEGAEYSWVDTSIATITTASSYPNLTLNTSPNFAEDLAWASIPSATTVDFFSPSDLPLVSPQFSNINQSISQSGDSSHQSIPGMTGTSSGTHESDAEHNFDGYWDANVQIRAAAGAAAFYNDENAISSTGSSLISKHPQSRHMSSSSAITAINVSAPLVQQSQPEGGDSSAILIPAGDDAAEDVKEDWAWQDDFKVVQSSADNSDMARQFNWLV